MKTLSKTSLTATAVVGALGLMAATPAAAQNYRDRNDNDQAEKAILGAVVGGLAGAVLGNGDGTYIAGGALAGAAVGAAAGSNNGDDCSYYRGGRCYRNEGHWEREHGINSRDYNSRYQYNSGQYDGRQYGYDNNRYVDGRTYQGRGYYRDGRFWRNHGEWRSSQNRNRDYRYDRRW
ncbi:hypothetical protein [Brevundimonas sp. Root1279]|uniref:hypothetical protein n=1 Tax=Brevundimonas sp. Root1279 TaxID=1736443 RepID=UPI0007002914|nr:hypothetical protein [Brevundimonas sp. Root1279]KQW81995.1 hypothetical protein ASC65_12010 [Brevundimonas sp. Root1279]